MTTTQRPSRARVAIIIDVYDQPLLTVVIWAQHSAHKLTDQLWDHGVLAHVTAVEIDPYLPLSP